MHQWGRYRWIEEKLKIVSMAWGRNIGCSRLPSTTKTLNVYEKLCHTCDVRSSARNIERSMQKRSYRSLCTDDNTSCSSRAAPSPSSYDVPRTNTKTDPRFSGSGVSRDDTSTSNRAILLPFVRPASVKVPRFGSRSTLFPQKEIRPSPIGRLKRPRSARSSVEPSWTLASLALGLHNRAKQSRPDRLTAPCAPAVTAESVHPGGKSCWIPRNGTIFVAGRSRRTVRLHVHLRGDRSNVHCPTGFLPPRRSSFSRQGRPIRVHPIEHRVQLTERTRCSTHEFRFSPRLDRRRRTDRLHRGE